MVVEGAGREMVNETLVVGHGNHAAPSVHFSGWDFR